MAKTDRSKLNKAVSVVLGIIAALFFVAATVLLVKHYWPIKSNYGSYMNSSSDSAPMPVNPVNFGKYKEKNQDVCGFIEMESLDIHEPIVCAGPDKPAEYYLRRDLDEKYSVGGTVFIEQVNSTDFSDPCTVIYGHNMHNLTMFGRLKEFRDKKFFDENEFFNIYCPGHIKKYAVKSAFVYDDRHINNAFNNFETEYDFMEFVKEVNDPQSLVKNVRESVEIKEDSKLAVLSTCTNIDAERYLVVGVLVEDIKTQ